MARGIFSSLKGVDAFGKVRCHASSNGAGARFSQLYVA